MAPTAGRPGCGAASPLLPLRLLCSNRKFLAIRWWWLPANEACGRCRGLAGGPPAGCLLECRPSAAAPGARTAATAASAAVTAAAAASAAAKPALTAPMQKQLAGKQMMCKWAAALAHLLKAKRGSSCRSQPQTLFLQASGAAHGRMLKERLRPQGRRLQSQQLLLQHLGKHCRNQREQQWSPRQRPRQCASQKPSRQPPAQRRHQRLLQSLRRSLRKRRRAAAHWLATMPQLPPPPAGLQQQRTCHSATVVALQQHRQQQRRGARVTCCAALPACRRYATCSLKN